MDQKTANAVALIKTITVAVLSIIAIMSIVLLAWVHDGSYAQIAQSALPELLFGSGGLLVFMHAVDSISGAIVQRSATSASAQVQIAAASNGSAEPALAEPATMPAPVEPIPAEPTPASPPAADAGPLIG